MLHLGNLLPACSVVLELCNGRSSIASPLTGHASVERETDGAAEGHNAQDPSLNFHRGGSVPRARAGRSGSTIRELVTQRRATIRRDSRANRRAKGSPKAVRLRKRAAPLKTPGAVSKSARKRRQTEETPCFQGASDVRHLDTGETQMWWLCGWVNHGLVARVAS